MFLTEKSLMISTELNFGQWLTLRKKALKLTQAKIAKALRVDRVTISNWENNVSIPSLNPSQTRTLCSILDVELEELASAFEGKFKISDRRS